ncbi:MAG TPA: baseplate J/gp47 family protein [Candidatus Limnocylindria bacterium]|nr:baseplate J/gp47 family protein [Candidatus Limnocylindria bacterium]
MSSPAEERAPSLGIERVESVWGQGDKVVVRLQMSPRGSVLPAWLAAPQAVDAALDDAVRTALEVVAVTIVEDRLDVTVRGVEGGQRFVLRVDGLIAGHDTIAVAFGVDPLFDPASVAPQPPSPASTLLVDYLAKDYASFKRLMLDVISHEVPALTERSEADLGIAIVEVLAFAADHLSYFQDAVATEAYLETARRRVSVRRHARLTGHRLFEGCTARVWMHVAVGNACTLPPGFAFATMRDASQGRPVFETLHAAELHPLLNEMAPWNFGKEDFVLPAGSTAAMLERSLPLEGDAPPLQAGTVLILEQIVDEHGAVASSKDRHAVRLTRDAKTFAHPDDPTKVLSWVTWFDADALPFAASARRFPDGRCATRALGNVVAADFGETIALEDVGTLDESGALRIVVDDLTFAVPYDASGPASALIGSLQPYRAIPQIVVDATAFETTLRWRARRDLIGAGSRARVFAVEVERDGNLVLRFGDGTHGWLPDARARFAVTCRTGNGTAGNVGAETIVETVVPHPDIRAVRNPLPSGGARDRQEIASAKRQAPERVFRQRRCVSDADYVALATRQRDVVSACVQRRWTGSSMTIDLYVHGEGDPALMRARVEEALAPARVLGVEVDVRSPRKVPVRVDLSVTYAPPATAGEVSRGVANAVAAAVAGQRLTLGTTVFASWFIHAARDVAGVRDVMLSEFRRTDGPDARAEGFIRIGPTEVAVLVDERRMITRGRPIVRAQRADAAS